MTAALHPPESAPRYIAGPDFPILHEPAPPRPAVSDRDAALAATWRDFYRARGFNVLASRPDAKRPFFRFGDHWETPLPDWHFGPRWPHTSNLQVMAGRRWGLLVVDLDGPAARDWLRNRGRPVPATWAVHSGGDGLHLWFRVPETWRPLPRAVLWRGEGKHAAVERLCDRSLVMAPPSVHPETGNRYRFLSRRESPACLPMPAPCPRWILDLRPVVPERPDPPATLPIRPVSPKAVAAGRYRTEDVLAAIPDKAALAREWGLRIVDRPAGRGAVQCRAIDREDAHPSALFKTDTGQYWSPWCGGRALSLFDLGAELGVYSTWLDAVSDLGRRYGAAEVAR